MDLVLLSRNGVETTPLFFLNFVSRLLLMCANDTLQRLASRVLACAISTCFFHSED